MIRWGVLGAARIAVKHMIPAIQNAGTGPLRGIASRDVAKAEPVAAQFAIERVYGSYEDLLGDDEIDAVYIPLPNHMHVPWSIRALEAGKHVLCEKPIGLTAAEAQVLVDAASRHPHLKVMEAFMYRLHPQWRRARAIVSDGGIGDVRAIHTWFSYMNTDPVNVRNIKSAGGGALMDIGCYGISAARFITGREPARVSAVWDIDPRFATDRLVTATLDFGRAYATFTCATQMARYQRVDICGTDGTIEIEAPFNPPIDRRCTIVVRRSDRVEPIVLERANQFEEEIRAFACAITGGAALPIPLADSVANMEAIDAVRASAECGEWVDVERC